MSRSLAPRPVLDASEWVAELAAGWGVRPVLLRNPFGGPLFRAEQFFRLLVEMRGEIEEGDGVDVALYDRHRVALTGASASDRTLSPLAPLLPESRDRSLRGWVKRLQTEPRFETFGLFLNGVHAHLPFWRAMREVLRELGRYVAAPTSALNTDVFIGNYARTTFGVHRDRLDNLMFMVKGRRTMRLWSDAVWRERTGTDSDEETFQEYEAYQDDAESYELHAGDVLYWPAETWHVGEGDGETSISFNLDFPTADADDRVHPIVRDAFTGLLDLAARELEPPPPRPPLLTESAVGTEEARIQASVEALRGLVSSERFEVTVARQYLSRLTAGGFDEFPDADERSILDDGTILRGDPRFPIRSARIDEVLLVAACGFTRALPNVPVLGELVESLNGGTALRVGDLLDRHGDRWSEGGARRVLVKREVVKDLLEHLVAWRAVERIDVAAPTSTDADPWEPLALRGRRTLVHLTASPVDPSVAAARLRHEGVVVFPSLVGAELLARCRDHIRRSLDRASPETFGGIHAPRLRFDLPLDVDSPAGPVMRAVVTALAPLFTELVGAEGGVVEFSSLTSLPGATTQVKHPDSTIGGDDAAVLYSVFVALDDVAEESGPLGAWPGTHRSRFFEDEALRERVLSLENEVHVTVPAGTAVVMDSRTWHRGRANRSERARPVFYFSILGPGERPRGPTYTMPEVDGEPPRLASFVELSSGRSS